MNSQTFDPSVPVLTIDGPSGSGKGTISRLVAARLGWHYLDSGPLYRAVGVARGHPPDARQRLLAYARTARLLTLPPDRLIRAWHRMGHRS